MTVTVRSDTEIEFSRVFDAPRRLVFEAHARPEHVRRWWGPRGTTMTTCEIDFRPGGRWRFVLHMQDGREIAFFGEYREIVAPERFVWTFAFDGLPEPGGLESYTFTEKDGKTTLNAVGYFDSVESRDAAIATGMEKGAAETWDRLAELLASHAVERR
jgi:uncharacterized protein YndB with AHSA1/START domain